MHNAIDAEPKVLGMTLQDFAFDPKFGEFTIAYGSAEEHLSSGPVSLVLRRSPGREIGTLRLALGALTAEPGSPAFVVDVVAVDTGFVRAQRFGKGGRRPTPSFELQLAGGRYDLRVRFDGDESSTRSAGSVDVAPGVVTEHALQLE